MLKLLSRSLALVALINLLLPLAVRAEPVDSGHARVVLIADHSAAEPGQTLQAGLAMQLDPGWHVYWQNAGDAGLPPQLIVSDKSLIPADAAGPFSWPIPHIIPVSNDIMDYGYDDEVVFPFTITLPANAAGDMTLLATADFLICEEICVPEAAEVSLTLRAGAAVVNEEARARIASWRARTPSDWAGSASFDASSKPWALSLAGAIGKQDALRFFPFNHDIEHSAPQPVSFGPKGATLTLSPAGDPPARLEGVVVVENPDGSRKGFTVRAEPGERLEGTFGSAALAVSAGGTGTTALASGSVSILSLLFFAFAGGLILNLMPCVLPVLSMKALGLVSAAASGERGRLKAEGLAYLAGVLVSFLVLALIVLAVRAATGSANLGFQLQHAPTVALLSLLMFAIGLWLMGFFELGGSLQGAGETLTQTGGAAGAFFTGALAAMVGAPCVGPFLGAALGAVMSEPAPAVVAVFLALGFGLALPFFVLSFVPGLQRLLPKPGRWMETLKQFFAFPMFLTMAWLLSVLAQLGGAGAVGWTLAGATAIAFAVWLMRREKRGALSTALAALAALGGAALAAYGGGSTAEAGGVSSAYAAKYETEAWSPERVEALRAQGRPIFVDFTAAWCATCQLNKQTTLKTKAVQDAFEKNDVAFLVADFTRKDPVIAETLKANKRAGVPLYLWYAPGADEPEILPEILNPGLVIARAKSHSPN